MAQSRVDAVDYQLDETVDELAKQMERVVAPRSEASALDTLFAGALLIIRLVLPILTNERL